MVAGVSVVIPCYRCADTIKRAVKSVAEQTLKPFEVILVEDCSGDDTLDKLYELQEVYGSEWIKVCPLKENSGPGIARNKGWDMSSQDYIAFLDSDDSWHPKKIEIQYSWMIENLNFVLTGHNDEIVAGDVVETEFEYSSFYEVSKWQLLTSNRFSTPTVMVKRTLSERFPEGQRYSEDYNLWLRIIYSGKACARSDAKLAYLYKASYGESGLSSNLYQMEVGELSNYKFLYKNKSIGLLRYLFITSFSFAKYLKRIIF